MPDTLTQVALFKVSQVLLSTLDLEEVLNLIIEQALEVMRAESGSVMIVDRARQELVLKAWRGLEPQHVAHLRRRMGEGIAGWVAQERVPLLLQSEVDDERFHGVKNIDHIKDSMCVPLLLDNEVVGVLSVNNRRGAETFNERDLQTLSTFGNHAAIALKNAQLYGQLTQQQQTLSKVLEKVISAQEEERNRLARDLHDGPTQALYAVLFQLQVCRRLMQLDPARAETELRKLETTVRDSVLEMRRMLHDLRPIPLDELGLTAALRQLFEGFLRDSGLRGGFEVIGKPGRLEPLTEVSIYRIVQEALNNVRKHARASVARLRLEFVPDRLLLKVEDNGVGSEGLYDGSEGRHLEHLGLAFMRERADYIGGGFHIESRPGEGTCVCLTVPLCEREKAEGGT